MVKDFIPGSAFPTSQTNAYVDSGLTAGSNYIYKILAYNSSVSSPYSSTKTDDASVLCPDLIVEPGSVEIINSTTGTTITPSAVPPNTAVKFRAKIRNQGGATPPEVTSFSNQFQVYGNTNPPYTSTDSLAGLGAGVLSPFVFSEEILSLDVGGHSLQVCADYPLPSKVREFNGYNGAQDTGETNNCLTQQFSFTVLAPLTVQLECEKAGGVFNENYCVIDYAQTSKLRWTVGGDPSSCEWVESDIIGSAVKESYTVEGNPLSLDNLLNKLFFTYKLKCSR